MRASSELLSNMREGVARPYRTVRDVAEGWLTRCYYRPRYHWPEPVLAVVGLTRSGTQWLVRLLAGVPGYRLRWPDDPDHCADHHDVCEAVFANLPRNRYSVLKLHTRFTPRNLQVLEQNHIRPIIMYRDLRDQIVSRYLSALYDPRHRHHQHYNAVSKEQGLLHSIEVALEESIPWVRDWLPFVSRYPDRFLEVRYEDLHADPQAVLVRVLAFCRVCLSPSNIARIVRQVAATTRFDLEANLRQRRWTTRKGIVGDWRNHFTERHVQRFKERCGHFLIQLGYEQDMNWTF